jgi:hypothetical protein
MVLYFVLWRNRKRECSLAFHLAPLLHSLLLCQYSSAHTRILWEQFFSSHKNQESDRSQVSPEFYDHFASSKSTSNWACRGERKDRSCTIHQHHKTVLIRYKQKLLGKGNWWWQLPNSFHLKQRRRLAGLSILSGQWSWGYKTGHEEAEEYGFNCASAKPASQDNHQIYSKCSTNWHLFAHVTVLRCLPAPTSTNLLKTY